LKIITAVAGSKFFSAKGNRTFTLVQLSFDEQCRLIADPTTTQGTISALAAADGYVEIGENEKIEINQEVTVHLFRGSAGKT
jgi:molybdopterin biosynthesis enzyme